ncbi:MAG: GIY-YIG nuclease family protein [archaeon]|nr:GIY-YIG nuclease family protein [archaeon]
MTKGAYILFIEIPNKNIDVQIGKLGIISFKKGFYCYIGSAMGKNRSSTSLEKRVLRHIKTASKLSDNDPNKPKKHWHIDYLLSSDKTSINKVTLIPSSVKEECSLAEQISKTSDGLIKNFGCSDCNCESHLLYFLDKKNTWF